jgi:hypothetical protein
MLCLTAIGSLSPLQAASEGVRLGRLAGTADERASSPDEQVSGGSLRSTFDTISTMCWHLLHRKTLRPDDRKTGFRFEHSIVPVRQLAQSKSTIDASRKLRVWGISTYPSLGGRGTLENALSCQNGC